MPPRANGHGLKLAVVSHSYMEPVLRQKWQALRSAAPELELLLITPRDWTESDFWPIHCEPCQEERLRVVPLPIFPNGYLSRHVYVSPALPSLLREFRPDIIQVEAEPWSLVYSQMVLLRRLLLPATRMVFFTWWNTPRRIPFPFSISHRLCLAATDLAIAGNHGALEILNAHGYRGRVEVVPQLGVDDKIFCPGPPDADVVARHGLAGKFVIGYIGRLTRAKGVGTLVEAAARLGALDCRLLIVGDGPERRRLEVRAATLGLNEQAVFAGTVGREMIPRYLRSMNVLVLPSLREQWEQFGHVLIEAMACGVPVIGSDSGEIPQVIGTAGAVFPMGDAGALTAQLIRMKTQEGFAAECRAQGLEKVRRQYSDRAIAERLREIYGELCGN